MAIALVLAVGIFVVAARIGGEDTWLCEDGQWVKHGNPSSAQPTTPCDATTNTNIEGMVNDNTNSNVNVGTTNANIPPSPKNTNTGTLLYPDWLQEWIDSQQNSIGSTASRCRLEGSTVYELAPSGDDTFSVLRNADGTFICNTRVGLGSQGTPMKSCAEMGKIPADCTIIWESDNE